MSLQPRLALSLALAACTARPLGISDSATDTGTTGDATTTTGSGPSTASDSGTVPTTSSSTTTGPVEPTTTDPGDPTTSGGCLSGCPPDLPHHPNTCDVWTQDCPEGQKCMPYSGDGDSSWESLKCVGIVPDPDGMYEPCLVFGSGVSGEDTCDKGLICWHIDQETGLGTCVGQCIGSPDAPDCVDPDAGCTISGGGVLTLCLPGCDPLLQDCPGADLCIPNPQDLATFLCVLDASGREGQVFDLCEYANACDKGLLCLPPAVAAECDPMAIGCCTPFCDTTLPNNCPGAGQECLSWFEEGQAPPGHEDVGVCALPMP